MSSPGTKHAYLLVRISVQSGRVIDARIYSERNPSQTFGDYCFAELFSDSGSDFPEAKKRIMEKLRASPLMWSWLRRFYKN